jgi:hypothetical protein
MKSGRIYSNQVRGMRRIFTAPVTADLQQFQVDLPRGPANEAAIVVVNGNSNNTSAFTSVRAGAAAKYVRRVDWVLNGNITLDSISGYGAWLLDSFQRKRICPITDPTVGVGTPAFRAVIPLWRVDPGFTRPKDSVLKTDENVTSNQLRIQLGALSDMFVVGTGVANYSAVTVTLSVYVIDYQEAVDKSGRTPIPLYYWKKTEQILNLNATGNGLPFRVNTGNRLRGFILLPQDSTNAEPSTAVLTRVRLQRSGDTRVDLTSESYQVQSLISIIQTASSPNAPAAGDIVANPTDSTGMAPIWIDLANPTGAFVARYSECWPVPSNADVQLLLDVATVGTARLLTIEGVDLYPA